MSLQAKILEGQRKVLEHTQEFLNFFDFAWVIIPFQVSGIQDYTNQGFVKNQINPQDAETFKRIWVGNDSAVLNWYGSVVLEKNENNVAVVRHKIGAHILGTLRDNNAFTDIDRDNAYSEFIAQQIRNSVTFEVSAKHFTITEYHQLMLYKIPKFSKEVVYKLSSINRHYEGKELVTYSLTFESANQDFATTGKAKQQNLNMSAPGQGYMNPLVLSKSEFEQQQPKDYVELLNGEYLTYDLEKLKNRPVHSIVVKAFGNPALMSVSCSGRPVKLGENADKFNYVRALFPINFKLPSTPTLYRTSNHSNNYYWGGLQTTLEGWKDWLASFKDIMLPANQLKFNGWVRYTQDLLDSNPKVNDTFTNSLYGNTVVVQGKEMVTPWEITLPQDTTITTIPTYGVASSYNIGGRKRIHDRMWDTFWTQKSIVNLPIDTKNTITYQSTVAIGGSMIGMGSGIFNGKFNKYSIIFGGVLLALGVVGTFINKLKNKTIPNVYAMLNASVVDLNRTQFLESNASAQNRLALGILTGENNTPSSLFFNTNTLNTMFEAQLTEFFTRPDSNKVFSTGNIGQTLDENGVPLFPDKRVLLVEGKETLVGRTSNTDGYIIDSVYIQSVFQGDFSIEFLDVDKNVVWSGVYQSQGKWSDNPRDIWTFINTSVFNNENVYFSEPLPYPATIPLPENIPDTLTDEVVEQIKVYQGAHFWARGYPLSGGTGGSHFPETKIKYFVEPKTFPSEVIIFEKTEWQGLNVLEFYKKLIINIGQETVEVDLSTITSQDDIVYLFKNKTVEFETEDTYNQTIRLGRSTSPGIGGGHGGVYLRTFENATIGVTCKFKIRFNVKYYRTLNKITFETLENWHGTVGYKLYDKEMINFNGRVFPTEAINSTGNGFVVNNIKLLVK